MVKAKANRSKIKFLYIEPNRINNKMESKMESKIEIINVCGLLLKNPYFTP